MGSLVIGCGRCHLVMQFFPHASVAIPYDVQALGGSVQSLPIGSIASDFFNLLVHNTVVHLGRVILHDVLEVAPNISEPIILVCPLWDI